MNNKPFFPFMFFLILPTIFSFIGCGGGSGGGGDGGSGDVPTPWVRQIRANSDDSSNGISVDATGNIYVAGITTGTLPGSPTGHHGGGDLFLVKYNSAGDNVWTRQMGSGDFDEARAVAVDNNGNIFMAGRTTGTIPGAPTGNQGSTDLFLVKYNSAGDNVWTRQMGSGSGDDAHGVAVDATGNVYVAGVTYGTLPGSPTGNQGMFELFLVKYNSAGDNVWTRQMGSGAGDGAYAVAVDAAGNAYVAGGTWGTLPGSPTGNLGNQELFLVKYNSAGDNVWTRQMGSGSGDAASAVAVDNNGNAYVAGGTLGTLPGSPTGNQGGWDPFLVKYNSSGDNVWTRQMGSGSGDEARAVAVDNNGNVYVGGFTSGTLPGSPTGNQGFQELFLVRYNSAGDNVWTRQMGSGDLNEARGVAVDTDGNVYVSGRTNGSLDGQPKAGFDPDVFIMKYLSDGTGP